VATLHSANWLATAVKIVLQSSAETFSQWKTSINMRILPVASFEARIISLNLETFSSSIGESGKRKKCSVMLESLIFST
jgi:hypothetical protein